MAINIFSVSFILLSALIPLFYLLAAPSVPTFAITRNGKLVTVVFGPLIKRYTGFQLRFCEPGRTPTTTGCSGSFFFIRDTANTNYTIHVWHETTMYVFYLDLYNGYVVVYSSGPVQSRHPEQTTAMPAGSGSNGGMIAISVVLAVVILVAVVVVVVVVVLYRRKMACFSGRNKPEGSNHDGEITGTTRPGDVLHEPFYMNVNRAFEGEQSSDDNPQQEKRVQEVVYDDTKLTDGQSGEQAAAEEVEGGDENPYDKVENPYADLNITVKE